LRLISSCAGRPASGAPGNGPPGGGSTLVSTANTRSAGVGSVLPASSVARTLKRCAPSASGPTDCGEEQGANPSPSRSHSKLEPASEELNAKLGCGSALVSVGPDSTVVSGGTVSTVNLRSAGVGSL
jgi:hypothetical protein